MTSSLLPRYVAEIFCANPAVPISSAASYLGYKQSLLASLFAYSCSFIRFLNSSAAQTRGGDCCSQIAKLANPCPSLRPFTRASRVTKLSRVHIPLYYGPTPFTNRGGWPCAWNILHVVCFSLPLENYSMTPSPHLCLPSCTPTSPVSRSACTSSQHGTPQAASELT